MLVLERKFFHSPYQEAFRTASTNIAPPLEFQGHRPRLPQTSRCFDAQVDRLGPSSGQTELSAGLKARN